MIANAKDTFLRKVAAEGDQGVSAILNRAKRAGIGARARAPVRRELPKLLNPTKRNLRQTGMTFWLQFFGEQEAGQLLSTERLSMSPRTGPFGNGAFCPVNMRLRAFFAEYPRTRLRG